MQAGDEPLVEFPKTYDSQIHELLGRLARRHDSMKEWLGPRRLEETPIGLIMAAESQDPKVCAYRC